MWSQEGAGDLQTVTEAVMVGDIPQTWESGSVSQVGQGVGD